MKAISQKPPKVQPQIEQRFAGGHDIIECQDCRETITWCSRYHEESSLRLAVKQSQFGQFLLFSFPGRYYIYGLSFMKASIKHVVLIIIIIIIAIIIIIIIAIIIIIIIIIFIS